MLSVCTHLELHEFGDIEPESEQSDNDDVIGRMTAANANPQRFAHGKISLQAHGQRGKYGTHLGDMDKSVEKRQRHIVNIGHPWSKQGPRLLCKENKQRTLFLYVLVLRVGLICYY